MNARALYLLGIPAAAIVAAVAAVSSLVSTEPATAQQSGWAASEMTVLTRGGDDLQGLPAGLVRAQERLPDERRMGRALVAKTKLLMENVGLNGVSIYAFPTERGAVCVFVTETATPGTCLERFDRDRVPIAVNFYSGQGVPLTVAGVVPDAVERVEILEEGVVLQAAVSSNAVFFQSRHPNATDPELAYELIDAVIVRYRNGTVVRKVVPH